MGMTCDTCSAEIPYTGPQCPYCGGAKPKARITLTVALGIGGSLFLAAFTGSWPHVHSFGEIFRAYLASFALGWSTAAAAALVLIFKVK